MENKNNDNDSLTSEHSVSSADGESVKFTIKRSPTIVVESEDPKAKELNEILILSNEK